MIVHYVEVYPVRSGGDNVGHFFAQLGEVSRKNARGDDEIGSGHFELLRKEKKAPRTGPKTTNRRRVI